MFCININTYDLRMTVFDDQTTDAERESFEANVISITVEKDYFPRE